MFNYHVQYHINLPEDSILINYRVFSDENLSIFKNSLQDINWNPLLINDNADEAYDLFQSTLLSVLMNTSPSTLTTFLVVGKVNLGLLLVYQLLFAGNDAHQKKRQYPERFLTEYRGHRNLLTKVTRTASELYYHNLRESYFRNSKKVYSNINTILGKNRKSSSTSIKLKGIIINEPEVIASSFNLYFNSIPTTLSNSINNNILTFEN